MHRNEVMFLFSVISLVLIISLSLNTYLFFNTIKISNDQSECFQAQYSCQQAELRKIQSNIDGLGKQLNAEIKSSIAIHTLAQNLLKERAELLAQDKNQDKLTGIISEQLVALEKKAKYIDKLKREVANMR